MAVRCYVCRTRRATFASLMKHQEDSGHGKPCACGGYHYPHRPNSPYCHQNPCSELLHADRHGATAEDLVRIARHIAETTPSAGAKASEILEDWGIE